MTHHTDVAGRWQTAIIDMAPGRTATRGRFRLSRAAGLLAHVWQQTEQGGRKKGPTPPDHSGTHKGA